MGLGKTIQAISVAYIYKDEWPLLIVVPSSLKFCWIEELEKWLPDILPHEINLVHSGGDIRYEMTECLLVRWMLLGELHLWVDDIRYEMIESAC